ncbi:hypothetical protein [Thermocrinis minervae]|uniref:Uncharacterized protein n=1 Tax=Thermocrinis minervae TaxID=381751 RepID=A0A1M6Q1T2_9AQUI|nr:hypothetical protein [Thermocrinis minervae]SHK14182.1 hypothetical protein SAMN05444391_0044 [Thermocrinis minervae]
MLKVELTPETLILQLLANQQGLQAEDFESILLSLKANLFGSVQEGESNNYEPQSKDESKKLNLALEFLYPQFANLNINTTVQIPENTEGGIPLGTRIYTAPSQKVLETDEKSIQRLFPEGLSINLQNTKQKEQDLNPWSPIQEDMDGKRHNVGKNFLILYGVEDNSTPKTVISTEKELISTLRDSTTAEIGTDIKKTEKKQSNLIKEQRSEVFVQSTDGNPNTNTKEASQVKEVVNTQPHSYDVYTYKALKVKTEDADINVRFLRENLRIEINLKSENIRMPTEAEVQKLLNTLQSLGLVVESFRLNGKQTFGYSSDKRDSKGEHTYKQKPDRGDVEHTANFSLTL